MSTLALKGLKLTNFHYAAKIYRKIRCSRSLSVYECRHLVQNLLTPSNRRCLATVAHKFDGEDSRFSDADSHAPKSVEHSFSKIDAEVRRTGRTSTRFVQEVFEQIKSSGAASSLHGLYLIRCCGRLYGEPLTKKIPLVTDIWKTLQKFNTPLNSDHYNALLKFYLQNDIEFSPMEILSEMEKQNVDPNKATYQLFIEKFCREGDFNGASVILEYMKEKDFVVNEDVFNSLIKCHAKTNDMEGAKNMLDVMRQSNLQPSAKTFSILSCAYAENGDIVGVNDTLIKAHESKIVLSNQHYIEIITSLAVGGCKDQIDKLISKLYMGEEEKQDFITAIMNLIYKGFDDVAYKFLLLLGASNMQASCNLFLKLLTKSGKPVETVIGYCEKFEKQGCDQYIYLYASRVAVDYSQIDDALALLKEMQKKGLPARSYFFNDIIHQLKEENNFEDTWKVLSMMYELGIPPYFVLIYNCAELVVKNNVDPVDAIAKFEACGHSVQPFLNALFQCYCEHFQLDHAKYIMQHYPTCIGLNFPLNKFISSYNNSEEKPEIFIEILESIMLGEMERNNSCSKFLVKLMNLSMPIFKDFLMQLNKKDIKLKREDFVILENAIKGKKATHLIPFLQNLNYASSDSSTRNNYESMVDIDDSICKLEENLSYLKEKDEPTFFTLYKLLQLYLKKKDLNQITDIIDQLDNQNFDLSPSIYSQLINLYSISHDLEMAEKLFSRLKNRHPDFKIDSSKLVNYAMSLLMHGKHNEAIQVLETELKNSFPPLNQDLLIRNIKKLLNSASETGDVSLVKNLYKPISSACKFVTQESLFEPLVKVHLVREDLDGAIEEYRECAKMHKAFPCKSLLLRRCIFAEDPTFLQRVVDATVMFAGESSALCELASVFLELGHISKAKKIFQNLGGKANFSDLEKICDRFFQQSKDFELSQLILITQDLWHIDREKLYHYLFQLYANRNDYVNALEVWNLFKRENLQPSGKTCELLSNLFKRNNQPLPFEDKSPNEPVEQVPLSSKSYEADTEEVKSFLKCVDADHTTEALEMLKSMKKGHVRCIPVEYMSKFVDSLIRQDKFKDISFIVQPMTYIIDNSSEIFKPLFKKYASAGDVDAFHQLQRSLPDFLLKQNYYNYHLSNAYLVSERYEDLLSELEKRCDKRNKLFSVNAFQELLKIPELEERVLNLAKRYMTEMNFDVPLCVIWAHHFINEDYSRAEDFYKVHSVAVSKVESTILRSIRNDENIKLGRKYIDLLIQLDLSQKEKNKAYRSQLDVLVSKQMYTEASSLIAECERQKVPLHCLSRTTLIALEGALKRENIEVTFSIPEQNKDSDDSSTDSD